MQVNNGAEKKRTLFDTKPPPKIVIAAKLIIMPKAKPASKIIKKEEKKQAEKTQLSVPIKKTVKSNNIKNTKKLVIKDINKTPTVIKNKAPVIVKQQELKTLNKPTVIDETKALVTRPISSSKDDKKSALSTMDFSRKVLQRQVSQAPIYNAEYENGGMSVMNNNLRQHEYTQIDISVEEKRLIKITCDSTTKKVTAVLAGLMGGTLRCEPGPDLSKFIKQKAKPKFKYKLDQ